MRSHARRSASALAPAPPQEEARQQWAAAAHFRGDFQGMQVCAFSEMSLYSALALRRLGREEVGAQWGATRWEAPTLRAAAAVGFSLEPILPALAPPTSAAAAGLQEAREMLEQLAQHARRLKSAPASIDYFATSLPDMLLFEDDLQYSQVLCQVLT